MRDEVLAEWQSASVSPEFHIFCHVSGGLVVGTAAWRNSVFRTHLPQALHAFRYGDKQLFFAHPELDYALSKVHYKAS